MNRTFARDAIRCRQARLRPRTSSPNRAVTVSTYGVKSLPSAAENLTSPDRGAGVNPRASSRPYLRAVCRQDPIWFRLIRVRERSGTNPHATRKPLD